MATTREKIAEIVSIDNVNKTTLDERTQAILDISEIKEGLELREKAESGKLVELGEDQSEPIMYEAWYWKLAPDCNNDSTIYDYAKADMKAAGFRRVKVKG